MRSEQGKLEYFKAPEKTAQSMLDGFIHVGDIGYVDEDGRLYPCDRAIDMIISGGVNIYPAEVEAVLLEHPAVGDVAVFGIPSEEWGEEVKAVVEPRDGHEGSAELEQELIEFVRVSIAHLKCPRSVDFRAEIPRAENGKLYKRLMREEYWKGRERRI
jgi:long-chain acyl-CoA synthetase